MKLKSRFSVDVKVLTKCKGLREDLIKSDHFILKIYILHHVIVHNFLQILRRDFSSFLKNFFKRLNNRWI